MKKTLLFLTLIPVLSFLACGNAIDSVYTDLKNDSYESALTKIESILVSDPKNDKALLLKTQVKYYLGDILGAYAALDLFDDYYPEDTRDDLTRAWLLSLDSGDADEILENLINSKEDAYSGFDPVVWWEMVKDAQQPESASVFEHFEPTPQYSTLLAMEDDLLLLDDEDNLGARCKENVTKFKKKVAGPQLWISHDDMIYFNSVKQLERLLLRFLPIPGARVVAAVLMIRGELIRAKEKKGGCGVVIHWTWITFPSGEGYWVTLQK
jgi:tetratricopeptide (TPR) repeat protein